ncbi:hypothetical protein [Acetomicrobium sp.]
MKIFPPATGDLELRREAWLSLYREFLTDGAKNLPWGVGSDSLVYQMA